MLLLWAFNSACVCWAAPGADASPVTLCHSACMWENHSTPTPRATGSIPAESTQPLSFADKIQQNLMELITCVQGREGLLGFKEQIIPSK